MTAAAGKKNDGNDDEPQGVVIEQIAKTVIHGRTSKSTFKGGKQGSRSLSLSEYATKREMFRKRSIYEKTGRNAPRTHRFFDLFSPFESL